MPDNANGPIPRVEISDYAAFGRKVVEWATDPGSQPTSLEDFKKQLAGIAKLPERVKDFKFVQSTLDTLVIRLPPAKMAQEGLDRAAGLGTTGDYDEPRFYKDRILGGDVGNLEYFFSRVGDYTIAQCK